MWVGLMPAGSVSHKPGLRRAPGMALPSPMGTSCLSSVFLTPGVPEAGTGDSALPPDWILSAHAQDGPTNGHTNNEWAAKGKKRRRGGPFGSQGGGFWLFGLSLSVLQKAASRVLTSAEGLELELRRHPWLSKHELSPGTVSSPVI